jgi:hypothetical protein
MLCPDIHYYVLTEHARWEMARRGITAADVDSVLGAPEQREMVRSGRCVYQAKVASDDPPRLHLLRVFVDTDRDPPEVVTVYRTSKVQKYWR